MPFFTTPAHGHIAEPPKPPSSIGLSTIARVVADSRCGWVWTSVVILARVETGKASPRAGPRTARTPGGRSATSVRAPEAVWSHIPIPGTSGAHAEVAWNQSGPSGGSTGEG